MLHKSMITYFIEKNNRKVQMRLILSAAIALGCSTASYADDSKSQFFVELYTYGYTEPSVMSKDAEIGFVGLGFQNYGSADEDGFIANGRYFVGTTAYSSSGTGTTDNDLTSGFSAEVAYKKQSFFAGLGYRQLYDNWGGKQSSTGHWSYDRKSQYLYVPIGSMVYMENGGHFKSQFNYLIGGKQTSYLGGLSGYADTTNTQKSGWGVELEYAPLENYAMFVRHWNIEDSTVNNGLYEPSNTTTEIGVKYAF